jgi:hypothetical protein
LHLRRGHHRVLDRTRPMAFNQKPDSGDGGEHAREARTGAPFAHGKSLGYLYSYLTRSLALALASLVWAPTRTIKKLVQFLIPK